MVTVHRNYFEELLANSIPLGEITIENLAKKPIQEIPLNEMLALIKKVYETPGWLTGWRSIKIYHIVP